MKNKKPFSPVILLFIILNALFLTGRNTLGEWNVDQKVLIAGNILLFVITLISFLLAQRGLKSSNTHVFIRAVIGSIMIKLFVSIIAAFIYISVFKKQINKPALFICMGLYLIYTFLEVSILTKQLKLKSNAPQRSTH